MFAGIDAHKDTHAVAVIDAGGRLDGAAEVPPVTLAVQALGRR